MNGRLYINLWYSKMPSGAKKEAEPHVPPLVGLRRSRRSGGDILRRAKYEPVPFRRDIHMHRLAFLHAPLEDRERQRVLQFALNSALQRARPIDRVVAHVREIALRRVAEFQPDPPLAEQPLQVTKLDADDLAQVFARQAVEQDHLVDPVQELWTEGAVQLCQHGLPDLGLVALVLLFTQVAAGVAGHDDHGVPEV